MELLCHHIQRSATKPRLHQD
uniref:Uncharacterized protein n=1 Tax=Anguilla anguilla TaxID=7936 RepID=A0A0E9XC60_ANGAN